MRGEQGRAGSHREHRHQRRRGRRAIRRPERVSSVFLSLQRHSRTSSTPQAESRRTKFVPEEEEGRPASSPRNPPTRERLGEKYTIFLACWYRPNAEGYSDQQRNQRSLGRHRRLLRGQTRHKNLHSLQAFEPDWNRERSDKGDERAATLLLAKEMHEQHVQGSQF